MAKVRKVKKSDQVFLSKYSVEWPCMKPSYISKHHAFCSSCNTNFLVKHGGSNDCMRHIKSESHRQLSNLNQQIPAINSFCASSPQPLDNFQSSITMAETLFANFIVEHNLPVAVADHANKLFKCMFPDSKAAWHKKLQRQSWYWNNRRPHVMTENLPQRSWK